MADKSIDGKNKTPSEKWYRFTGYMPVAYMDATNTNRWVVPNEVVAWEKPPDANWELVELDKEAYPSKDLFPSAGVLSPEVAEPK